MGGNVEDEVIPQEGSRGRHLKKKALENKALAVDFSEEDLKDYVNRFHSRKKRRKEAQRKQEEAEERRKRIELHKKRKLEKELALYGGVLPTTDPEPDEEVDENEEDREQVESIAETDMIRNSCGGKRVRNGMGFNYTAAMIFSAICFLPFCVSAINLQFANNGEFKILQVADMHYANGKTTHCLDVLHSQYAACSDLNTTAFIQKMILAEKPDLIVFTGDNIFGKDCNDPAKSMDAAFAPAIESSIPWVAILGNHDQEGSLSRERVMKHIVGLKNSLSRVNPPEVNFIDGFGNYNLEVRGVANSGLGNKSVLNLYFLDSGDYSTVPSLISGYGWIKPSQQLWYQRTSAKLQRAYKDGPVPQKIAAPGIAYFHIPVPEFASFHASDFTGVKQESIGSASVNSGFFKTLVETGDVKAVFTGHDHVNDFCGKLQGIHLCYGGGFGYHAYGKAGWSRRARVVVVSLDKTVKGGWGGVKSIKTWKRLDDRSLTTIDSQVLWSKSSGHMQP